MPPSAYEKPASDGDENDDPTPAWEKIGAWSRAVSLARLTTAAVTGQLGYGPNESADADRGTISDSQSKNYTLAEAIGHRQAEWAAQRSLLASFNAKALRSREFAEKLAAEMLVILDDRNEKEGSSRKKSEAADQTIEFRFEAFADDFVTWVQERESPHDKWQANRIDRFRRDIHWLSELGEGRLLANGSAMGEHAGAERLAALNRDLLSLVYPGVLYSASLCRTPTVAPHDQACRARWLCFWTACAFVGFIGTINLNQQSPLYRYYRRMLADKFLVGWIGPDKVTRSARRESDLDRLADCDTTEVGLPYPLMLGALLDPGRRRINRKPFLFSPGRVGITEGEGQFAVSADEFTIPRNPGSIKLVDAVAISGSALAPFMTCNRALQLILGFFNLRLGQWVENPRLDPRCWVSRPIRFFGSLSVFREVIRRGRGWRYGFVADGGFVDYLGVAELLERRCRLIVVTDSGSNIGGDQLGTLARMLEEASTRHGVRFVDLDHEAPIDFGRLAQNSDRMVPQPFICMRIRYPEEQCATGGASDEPAYLLYVQMAITESDPIEIRQIRHRFPIFPDEPTVNQFYSEEQVAAYRQLGYHIGNRVCSELVRWSPDDLSAALARDITENARSASGRSGGHEPCYDVDRCDWNPELSGEVRDDYASGDRTPLFNTMVRRLLAGYRMACYEETSYREGDIYAEAVWDRGEWFLGSFAGAAKELRHQVAQTDRTRAGRGASGASQMQRMRRFCDGWLRAYEGNADVRTAYRRAVFFDLNCAIVSLYRKDAYVNYEVYRELYRQSTGRLPDQIDTTDWDRLSECLDGPPPLEDGSTRPDFAAGVAESLRRDGLEGHGLFERLLGDSPRLETTDPWPLSVESGFVMAAHLAASAVACHQLRRGTPHQVFQIGGRDKLIDLVVSIVRGERRTQGPEAWLRGASPEVVELQRCVFQEAEVETAASFAYVMTMLLTKVVNPNVSDPPKPAAYGRLHKAIRKDRIDAIPDILLDVYHRREADTRDAAGPRPAQASGADERVRGPDAPGRDDHIDAD